MRSLACTIIIAMLVTPLLAAGETEQPELRWYKGNTHTHTLNSDGDSTPDEVARWYRSNGYQFLVLSDHNVLTGIDTLNGLYGAKEQFLLIPGEEVTDVFEKKAIHVNGLGIREQIAPRGGTSVTLDDYHVSDTAITITIRDWPGAKFTTRFIGHGGRILAETGDNPAVYELTGDEPYVRAKIIDSNGRVAWTQPTFPSLLRMNSGG